MYNLGCESRVGMFYAAQRTYLEFKQYASESYSGTEYIYFRNPYQYAIYADFMICIILSCISQNRLIAYPVSNSLTYKNKQGYRAYSLATTSPHFPHANPS